MKSLLISAVMVALAQCVFAADPRSPRVESYTLDVAFDPQRRSMTATALIRFNDPGFTGDSITCYLHGELTVDSMVIDGADSPFHQYKVFYDYDYSLIANAVTLPTHDGLPQTIRINYSGVFNPSEARSPSDYMRIDPDGVFLRAYGYSLWFPIFLPAGRDDYTVDFVRVTTRLPQGLAGVFGGTRLSNHEVGDTVITVWTAAGMPLFDAQFTARPFEILGSEGEFEILHLTDSASAAAAQSILTFARELCAQYARVYRTPSRRDNQFIMETPPYGDISSGSVTGLMESTWKIFADDENAQRALAHELVHPYVALDIPRNDPAYSLATEGFPSYFHLPCVARFRGAEFYNRFVGWMEKLYMDKRATGKDRRGNPLPPEKPLLSITADELSTYKDEFVLDDRALLFLNYLRSRMGSRFDAFTSELFNSGVSDSGEFRALIAKYLPDADEEVHIWLDTTEYPERLHFSHFEMAENSE